MRFISFYFISPGLPLLGWIVFFASLFLLLFLISVFRIPNRILTINDNAIVAPADGKVVVIEESVDEEYFKDKRLKVSIFISPSNLHVNSNPSILEV